MVTLDLSPKLFKELEKLAEVKHVPVNELIESALSRFIDEYITDEDYAFADMEELKRAAAKAAEEEAAGIGYTLEEVDRELDEQIETYYKDKA